MHDSELYEKILGLVEPWCVERVDLDHKKEEVVIRVGLRGDRGLRCPECEATMPGYDTRPRRWRHLDTCQYKTMIEADVPRVECSEHGVHQIRVPWAEDRSQFTVLFERLAIDWMLEASQSAVARKLGLTWDEVHALQERAVERGMGRRRKEIVRRIGVDEKSFQKRHEYVTVVCDLEKAVVLDVGDNRRKETLDAFLQNLTPAQREGIESVAMDMWEPYAASVREHLPGAAIVFDKFHIVRHLSDAVDAVRRQENAALRAEGDDRLVGSRYWWLMHPARISAGVRRAFKRLRGGKLKTARAWALKETILELWGFLYRGAAQRFFDNWYRWAVRSRLRPMMRVARMLKTRLPNILSYIEHRITNAVSEALNSKIQWIKYTARGFRNRANYRTAILFHCGGLKLYPHETL